MRILTHQTGGLSERKFWKERIELSFLKKSIVWLQGVRRVGKTSLCKSFEDVEIFDCEKPSVRKLFESPEDFLGSLKSRRIAIDEIHRLENPSEVLKIAADDFSQLEVIATGSSTLYAKKKFKDTLTDRKRVVWLTPINFEDLKVFKGSNFGDRLFRGGLPPFLLSKTFDEVAYQDWIDSYWAKDIQELFQIENRSAFLKFFELLALQSGGLFEAESFSRPCGVSRPSIQNYLHILEATQIAIVLRPFAKNPAKEIIRAPKVYFFDTGFISFFNGWSELHDTERGHFFEHFVLNELLSILLLHEISYWRDKRKREIDFIIQKRGKSPITLECKWRESSFDPAAIIEFRKNYPRGENYLVTYDGTRKHFRTFGPVRVQCVPISQLRSVLSGTDADK